MRVNIRYEDRKIKVKGRVTEGEKKLYAWVGTSVERFYKAVEHMVEGTSLQGTLEIKLKKGKDHHDNPR